jgi:hypothetical protein
MLVLNSDIADVAGAGTAASTSGSQTGSTVICEVGNIVIIDGQRSSSKCKARDHGSGFRISGKRRTSSGGDDVNPDPIPVHHITPSVPDASPARCSSRPTAASGTR